MKTPSAFAKWLDKEIAYLESIRGDELDDRIGEESRDTVREAGRYASQLGLEEIECVFKVKPLVAKRMLVRYRKQVQTKDDLTVDEVAEKLGVSTQTIRAMVKDGRIAHHRVGRQIRIRAEDCVMREKAAPKLLQHLDRRASRRQSRGSKPSQAS